LFFRVVNSYSFLVSPFTQIGILSVSKTLFERIGKIFSSPSEKLPDLATILYCKPCNPSGILISHSTGTLSFALHEKFFTLFLLAHISSITVFVEASKSCSIAIPDFVSRVMLTTFAEIFI